mgnify:CR=1 FL=1
MRRVNLAVLLALCGCVNVPTPSGRPELKVRVSASEAKSRIVNNLSQNGYMVTSSDDMGVSATRPIEGSQAMFLGNGSFVVRFNLMPSGPNTKIRATVFVQTATPGDVSSARAGYDFQLFLENTFRDCMVDGPYIKS